MRAAVHVVVAAALAGCRAFAEDDSPISTDRPGFLFASTVVPLGAVQLEIGSPSVAWTRSADDDVVTALYLQLRYGATEELELRAAAVPYAHHPSDSDPDQGTGDLELGMKLALGREPNVALVGTVRLPTGEHQFTTDEPAFSVYVVAETALDGRHGFKAMLGWTRTPVGSGDDLDAAALAMLLGRSLDPNWSAYVESAWFPALESGPDPAYAGLGVARLLGSNAQLDLSADAGLNDDASDWLFSLGWSVRW